MLNLQAGKKLYDQMANLMPNKLNVIVYNFVDMLSHARTEMEIIRELADDEEAYRSLMYSWFEHSSLFDMMRFIAEKGCDMIITTDHGSTYVEKPVRILGDREVNTTPRRYSCRRSTSARPMSLLVKATSLLTRTTTTITSVITATPSSTEASP